MNNTHPKKLHHHLRDLAFDLGGKFLVGQHNPAVRQADHDEPAAFVVAEVKEGLAVKEGGAGAGEVGQLVAESLAGFLALKDGLHDLGSGNAIGAV
jgi:hypothetical protein